MVGKMGKPSENVWILLEIFFVCLCCVVHLWDKREERGKRESKLLIPRETVNVSDSHCFAQCCWCVCVCVCVCVPYWDLLKDGVGYGLCTPFPIVTFGKEFLSLIHI